MASDPLLPRETFGGSNNYSTSEQTCATGGHKLHCYYWKPTTSIRALVLLIHGFGEHLLYYEEIAEHLRSHGFFVYGHDHAGHGKSEGSRCRVESADALASDVLLHVEKLRSLYDLPHFILSHSMGSTVALRVASKYPAYFTGIIFVAPFIKSPEVNGDYSIINLLAEMLSKLVPELQVRQLDLNNVCRDVRRLEFMRNDKLRCGAIKARTAYAFVKMLRDVTSDISNLKVPFLALHGGQDRLASPEGSELLYETSNVTPEGKAFKVYPHAHHNLFHDLPEVRRAVRSDILDWLESRLQ